MAQDENLPDLVRWFASRSDELSPAQLDENLCESHFYLAIAQRLVQKTGR